MKISVIGTGYVGLVTGTCFAEKGNNVWCVDVDKEKIKQLNDGMIPIYEPDLEEMVRRNRRMGFLHFTTDINEALRETNVCFIAVGTPMGGDGSTDLQYVIAAASAIGRGMVGHTYVVDKSTVPVGTAALVREIIQKELDGRGSDLTFDVIANPEFLKEGNAVGDCMRPDRVVIGTDNREAAELMRELYKSHLESMENLILMDVASAEMTKYAANAMLATKISFMNEISNICEQIGADVNKVRLGLGSDPRIGHHFIYPGCGYGGSCFPKDVRALIQTSRQYGYEPEILKAVETVNNRQKKLVAEKVIKEFGKSLLGRHFAVWGLAYKPDTDDMRESPAITIINELTARGANVTAYDPKAMQMARTCYLKGNEKVAYADNKYNALNDADALILITEWKEFRQPDFREISMRLKSPVIFDGRNQYDKQLLEKKGIKCFQIGVG